MVPGSTFKYGSNFMMLTLSPRLSSRHPIEAAASPLPSEDTTPPVTKMYFADISASLFLIVVIGRAWDARSSIASLRGRPLCRPSFLVQHGQPLRVLVLHEVFIGEDNDDG